MSLTIESALDENGIEEPRKFLSEYQFSLKGIPVLISVRFYQILGRRWVEFEQSHYIKTPTQMGPYMTSRPGNDYEASALHQVISGLTGHYNDAIKSGHEPDESWLVKNEDY